MKNIRMESLYAIKCGNPEDITALRKEGNSLTLQSNNVYTEKFTYIH
jgi:hypothetical protein